MEEHAEALEADLLRHYGTDLLDWHRGRLSSRRLAVLVKRLPRDSALVRDLHGEAADWSVTDYLLATAVDQLAESNWMFATVNQDEEAETLEYPVAVRRPGAADVPGPGAAAEDISKEARPSSVELTRFFS
ncbi:hypothetical protein [Streptomyces cyaneofuscatus]|uniref:Uncharacterized protein n=1 Tax=Streptomyces cyaneofuscatus TaxID=66883 RepID=A0ABZ1EZZ9_9ACTN|nr:hypothetical protein [Streptomyces cyaneofuscatus]WSB09710.1 hypothetical protein OG849_21990 [Streptomyces cyaneofuscatus]WSD46756.1 hypothetical protein OG857_13415 [Streptomyces cyaneofuscatus]